MHCTVKTKKIYERTCLQSHGARVFPLKGKVLLGGPEYFNRIIAKGTVESSRPYMPGFTLEGLSRQRVADVQAQPESLPK